MSELKIITDNKYRPVLYWYDLLPKEQAEYSEVFRDSSFFRYRGWVYTLDDFMRVDGSPFYGYDGYMSESFFSGLVVKYSNCGDAIKVGRWYS